MKDLSPSVISSFKLALSKMTGHTRRLFAAELAKTYFNSSSRKTERILGVSRDMVDLGLHELRTDFRCLENFSQRGRKKKEFKFSNLSADIDDIVSLNTQSDRCHNDTKGYIKTTALQVKTALISHKGYIETDFCHTTINNILNRLGYCLTKVLKTLPLKRIEETDAIFENIAKFRQKDVAGVLKISMDTKDKVKVGKLSRKGYHRQKVKVKALDKDMQSEHKLVPLGILEIKSAISTVILGNSHETSDFIVDGLEKWYELRKTDLQEYHTIEIYLDNGPSVNGQRTQFINRMMEFACITGLNIHLLYYPPYHSKYNPIERVWAAVENYWNGTLLTSVDKVVNTLGNVTWKSINLTATLLDKVYQKGITLSDVEMEIREQFIQRNQLLPKWDILIKPSYEMGMLFIE